MAVSPPYPFVGSISPMTSSNIAEKMRHLFWDYRGEFARSTKGSPRSAEFEGLEAAAFRPRKVAHPRINLLRLWPSTQPWRPGPGSEQRLLTTALDGL